MIDKYFYTTGEIGLEYETAQELVDFLKANKLPLSDWLEKHYQAIAGMLTWGDLIGARAGYDLILEVYEIIFREEGREVLK